MWEIALPLVYINLFGAVIYVLLCGQQDCHRDTFVERWNAFLLGGCFESLADMCGNVFGKKARGRIDAIGDRCCNKPNPIFQILYLACVLGPFIFFIVTSWHHLGGPYAPAYHKYLSFVFVGMVVAVYFHVCRSNPGRITPATLVHYKDNYPYDHILYEEKFCKTCQLPRPARSMHCRICDACVSRFDHHCVWINNCVGERNQKKFIAFLFATSGLCFYGFLVASGVVAGIIEKEGILHYVMKNRTTGEITPVSYPTMFVIVLFEAGPAVMVAFFSLIMGIVLFLFAFYHVHLVYSNTTTAETFKWGDLKHDVVVAKNLLKKIDKEKKQKNKDKKKEQKKQKKQGKSKSSEQIETDTEDSDDDSEDEEEKKRKAKGDDPRFGSELYRHRKTLTYSMHKRLSQRVKMDHMGWFAYKADQLDRQQQQQRHDQTQQSAKQHQKQAKKDNGATEEERRYEEMTEEKLNRAFLQELRWLADELEVDNIYNRGWRSNFAEVLDPISERKMAAGLRTKKRK